MAADLDIATPQARSGLVARLASGQRAPASAARLAAWVGRAWDHPVRLRDKVIVARHAHVTEALSRDLDFLIAPINAPSIDAVNGPFVLGMDRGATLVAERRALYAALAGVDIAPLQAAVTEAAAVRIAAAGGAIDVAGGYARPIAAATARGLFGIGGSDDRTFMDVARAVFGHVFFNINGDQAIAARAMRAAPLLRGWLDDEIARRRASGAPGTDMMGMLLRGGADDRLVQRTLGGMLVGAIDTTAAAVAKIAAVIGHDQALQARIAADLGDADRLAGWCREALRRWPHNPLLRRRAAVDTQLGGTKVRAGDSIVLWTQAAMLDPSAFPDPATLRPDRPVGAYLHFGAGLHPCAGRVVNGFQIPLLVGALVRRGIRSVGDVTWAGPFPDRLVVQLGG